MNILQNNWEQEAEKISQIYSAFHEFKEVAKEVKLLAFWSQKIIEI